MKKIHGHENAWVSAPPSTSPTAAPPEAIAAQTASAFDRSAPSANVVVMIASAAGEMNAPPRPWSAREAISAPDDQARPLRSDASREHDDAEQEQALASEQVARAAAEEQEAAEDERVRVDDPLEIRLAQAQVLLDRRERARSRRSRPERP